MASISSPWFKLHDKPRQNAVRLFCFHYAGGAASVFRDWPHLLSRYIDLIAVQLPGREWRFGEAPFRRMEPLISELADQITPQLCERYAFFGHSMGALVSFELLREIQRRKLHPPVLYFPAGRRAPQIPDDDPPIHHLPDHEFLSELLEHHDDRRALLMSNTALRTTLLPVMRADVELCETYHYRHSPPLNCTIFAFGGMHDSDVSEQDIKSWKEQTTATFRHFLFPGDHFFIETATANILQFMCRTLEGAP
jgi:medium-chain acyl-[acyl-carrier-protein] hydrolase